MKIGKILRGGGLKSKVVNALTSRSSAAPVVAQETVEEKTRRYIPNGRLVNNLSVNLGSAPCNHSCLFCPQSIEKPKKAEWLDLILLDKVLDELPEENSSVFISSYSETLAAPNLVDAIRLVKTKRPNLTVIMASNGSLYREQTIRSIMEAGLDWYSYSFDAATREDYLKMVGVDHFDKVWENLDKIVSLRNEIAPNMKITTHVMAFEGREQAFENFKAYWDPKLDGINFRRVSNWGDDELGILRQMAEAGFKPIQGVPKRRYPCMSIFSHLKLDHQGDYFPCQAAVPGQEVKSIGALGNAQNITVQEAWARMSNLRQAHLRGDWESEKVCEHCTVWTLWDDVWSKSPDGGFDLLIPDYAK